MERPKVIDSFNLDQRTHVDYDPLDLSSLVFSIPCCQLFTTSETGAPSIVRRCFQDAVEKILVEFSVQDDAVNAFLEYLYSQPSNRALAAIRHDDVIIKAKNESISSSSTNSTQQQTKIWWELVLCLIRNILCHEHYFDFRTCAELLSQCGKCFGSMVKFRLVLERYCALVLKHNAVARALHDLLQEEDSERLEKFAAEVVRRSSTQMCEGGDLKLLLRFVICRCNNSVVSEEFESRADAEFAADRLPPTASWDSLALFLLTHPANPDQGVVWGADSLSWLAAVRMIRNVVCHERHFDFRGLKELLENLLAYFGSRENIRTLLRIYEQHCRSDRFKTPHHHLSLSSPRSPISLGESLSVIVQPIAPIQVARPDNVKLLDCPDLGIQTVFLGSSFLESVITRKRPRITFLIGPSRSGKTISALYTASLHSAPILYLSQTLLSSSSPQLHRLPVSINSASTLILDEIDQFEDERVSAALCQILSSSGRLIVTVPPNSVGSVFGALKTLLRTVSNSNNSSKRKRGGGGSRSNSTSPVKGAEEEDVAGCTLSSSPPGDSPSFSLLPSSSTSPSSTRHILNFKVELISVQNLGFVESDWQDAQLISRHYFHRDKFELKKVIPLSISPYDLLNASWNASSEETVERFLTELYAKRSSMLSASE